MLVPRLREMTDSDLVGDSTLDAQPSKPTWMIPRELVGASPLERLCTQGMRTAQRGLRFKVVLEASKISPSPLDQSTTQSFYLQ